MNTLRNTRRFRINPVELAILLVITLVFFNSLYNLLYDRQGFHPTTFAQMSSNPISEGRSPASVTEAFLNIDVKCAANLIQDTKASKVRLSGELCGISAISEGEKLLKTQIINNTNKFAATVFTDIGAAKFSTDYIPLNDGKNSIHLEFAYRDGKLISQELTINKM